MDWTLLAVWLVVLALAGTAVLLLALALWSLGWKSVKGIVEASVLDDPQDGPGGSVVRTDPMPYGARESLALAYSYEVGGKKFLGSSVKPWGDYDWSLGYPNDVDGFWLERTVWSRARDLARWYRPGVVVDVYYCPFRPQWACLEPGGFVIPCCLGGTAAFFYFLLLY